ncbi:MAG: OmpH/Skp family outer membrane protein [Planctomycetota bacterium]
MITKHKFQWLLGGAAAVLTVLMILPLSSTRAQDGDEKGLKVGYVDMGRVFKKYPLTRTLAKDLRAWKIAQEEEMERKKKDLLELSKKIMASGGGSDRSAHAKMVGMNRELTEQGGRLQMDYTERVLKNDRKIYQNICAAMDKIAQDGGYDLILQTQDRGEIEADDIEVQTLNIKSRVLLFGADELDLTDLVLEVLEETGTEEEKK